MTTPTIRRFATTLLFASAVLAAGQSTSAQERVIRPSATVEVTPLAPIDTTTFLPQVLRTLARREVGVENAVNVPWLQGRVAPKNTLPLGGVVGDALPTDIARWPGVTTTGYRPADPTVAVGPNHVVVTVNCAIAFFSRNGALQFQQDFSAFFETAGRPGHRFDPRASYDPLAKRYYAIALEQDFTAEESNILLAVSDDEDPRGIWYRYRVEGKNLPAEVRYSLDYPGFGFNKDALVVSSNALRYVPEQGHWRGTVLAVMPKAQLLAGAPVTSSFLFDLDSWTYQMAEIADSGVNAIHGISVYDNGHLRGCTLTNLKTSPTLTTWSVPIPTFEIPHGADGLGGELDTLDGRLLSASYRSGRLLTAHGVLSPGHANTRSRWYELDVAGAPATLPTLVQSGEIASPTGDHYFMPAINKNAFGEISVIFTRSNPLIGPETMVAARAKNDPPGAMRTPFSMARSEGGTSGRWGDYFKVSIDPLDNRTFWGISMLAIGDPNFRGWRTEVSRWLLTPTIASLQVPATMASGTHATGTVTLTNPLFKDTLIPLTSSHGVLTVPDKIRVPAGAESASFPMHAATATATQDVIITATVGAISTTGKTRVFAPRPEFELSRASVEGGTDQVTTLTVRLGKNAPAAGVTVTLGSSSNLLNLPSELKVPGGKSTASVDFKCSSTPTVVQATVSATWSGTTRTRSLTVTPIEITSLSVSTGFIGGSSFVASGKVTIGHPAPAQGLVVRLTSDSPLLTVPETITIPSGSSAAEFTIQHTSTATRTNVKLTAVSGLNPISKLSMVWPPDIVAMRASSTVLTGGNDQVIDGEWVLNAPAPPGGYVIYVTSSDAALKPSSAQVTVPAGSVTVPIMLTTPIVVAEDREVRLVGSHDASRRIRSFLIKAPQLTLAVNPAEVVGGSSTKMTLTVNSSVKAPTGGFTIDLTSSLPTVAQVPSTVTIPAGQQSVTVDVTHFDVTSNKKVAITGKLYAVQKTVNLIIQR